MKRLSVLLWVFLLLSIFVFGCGGGGGVKGVDADLAMARALKKVDQAKLINAEAIVSGCPSCYDNINEAIKEQEANIRMMDIVEIIAEALGLD